MNDAFVKWMSQFLWKTNELKAEGHIGIGVCPVYVLHGGVKSFIKYKIIIIMIIIIIIIMIMVIVINLKLKSKKKMEIGASE